MITELFGINVERWTYKRPPEQNSKYLAFIRLWPCIVCFSKKRVEAAHMGPHGIGQKSCDYSALPVCWKHHRGADDSYHKLGPAKFIAHHSLDLEKLTQYFRQQFERLTEAK